MVELDRKTDQPAGIRRKQAERRGDLSLSHYQGDLHVHTKSPLVEPATPEEIIKERRGSNCGKIPLTALVQYHTKVLRDQYLAIADHSRDGSPEEAVAGITSWFESIYLGNDAWLKRNYGKTRNELTPSDLAWIKEKSTVLAKKMALYGDERLEDVFAEIDEISPQTPMKVFKGVEVDLMPDGEFDTPMVAQGKFELVNCSIHPKTDKKGFAEIITDPAKFTDLIIKAIRNPRTNIICHMTGDISPEVAEALNWEAIAQAAIDNKVAIEINVKKIMDETYKLMRETDKFPTTDMSYLSFFQGRLPALTPILASPSIRQRLKPFFEKGLKIAINTDEHGNPFVQQTQTEAGNVFSFKDRGIRFWRCLKAAESYFNELFQESGIKRDNILNTYSPETVKAFMDKTPSFDPFKSIPRFPEESPLNGPPTSEKDSAFLNDLPFYNYVASKLVDFKDPNKPKNEHQQIPIYLARKMLSSADCFSQVQEALTAVECSFGENYQPALQELRRKTIDNLFKEAEHLGRIPDEKLVGVFLELIAKNPDLGDLGRKIMRGFIKNSEHMAKDKPTDVEKQRPTIDLSTNIALYAIKSNDPEIEKLVAKIFSFSDETTDILSVEDNFSLYYVMATLSEDNTVLARSLDADHTFELFRMIHLPKLDDSYAEMLKVIVDNKTFKAYLDRLATEDPKRLQQISRHYDREKRESGYEIGTLPFPTNLLVQSRELRDLYRVRYTNFLNENGKTKTGTVIVTFPNGEVNAMTLSEEDAKQGLRTINVVPEILREKYQTGKGGEVEDPRAVVDCLTYLRPIPLAPEQIAQLEALVGQLKTSLWSDASNTINPNGDRVIIADPEITKFGLDNLLFTFGDYPSETNVTLKVDKYEVPLLLDEYHHLLHRNHQQLNISPEIRTWWESVVLSHLKGIVCRAEKAGSNTFHLNERNGESHSKFTSRRGGKRKLPAGQCYTQEQQQKLNEAGINIDLARYNAIRALTRETGMCTWVLPVDFVKVGGKKNPMVSRLPQATKEIQKILNSLNIT